MKKDWYTRMEKMENGNPFLPTSFSGLYHFWIGEEDTYFKGKIKIALFREYKFPRIFEKHTS